MLYGHRNDVKGYAEALLEFDSALPEIIQALGPEDLLIITADHGLRPYHAVYRPFARICADCLHGAALWPGGGPGHPRHLCRHQRHDFGLFRPAADGARHFVLCKNPLRSREDDRNLSTGRKRPAEFLKSKTDIVPRVVLVLGSGLGDYAERLEKADVVPYEEIPFFPRSTVEGHKARLIFGELFGVPVAMMQGRFHYYEGYTQQQITLPIRRFGPWARRFCF